MGCGIRGLVALDDRRKLPWAASPESRQAVTDHMHTVATVDILCAAENAPSFRLTGACDVGCALSPLLSEADWTRTFQEDPELASRRALYSSAETRTLDAGHFDVGISCVWDVSLKIQQLAGEKRSERDVRAEHAELCPVQCPRCPQCRCSRPELCSRFALRAFLVPVNMTGVERTQSRWHDSFVS
ncbi:unnamed protein product [Effrenium voratum]|nr:unnamed protein product [Effrenium voratum]